MKLIEIVLFLSIASASAMNDHKDHTYTDVVAAFSDDIRYKTALISLDNQYRNGKAFYVTLPPTIPARWRIIDGQSGHAVPVEAQKSAGLVIQVRIFRGPRRYLKSCDYWWRPIHTTIADSTLINGWQYVDNIHGLPRLERLLRIEYARNREWNLQIQTGSHHHSDLEIANWVEDGGHLGDITILHTEPSLPSRFAPQSAATRKNPSQIQQLANIMHQDDHFDYRSKIQMRVLERIEAELKALISSASTSGDDKTEECQFHDEIQPEMR